MKTAYRPRFEQDTDNPPPMADPPTGRDHEFIVAADRHDFLTSHHFAALFASSPTNYKRVLNRLRLLTHNGYLQRRKRRANLPMLYALGSRGARHLGKRPGTTRARAAQVERARGITRDHERHALRITDFMVAQELSCRRHPMHRMIHPDELLEGSPRTRLAWPVPFPSQGREVTSWAIPDCLYGLHSTEGGQGKKRHICLEIDCGTMPVVRSNPYQTSYLRKMLTYAHTKARDLLYREFGVERFDVLTLTSSLERIHTMQKAYREHVPRHLRRPNLFKFGLLSEIDLDTDVFELALQNANGKPARLAV